MNLNKLVLIGTVSILFFISCRNSKKEEVVPANPDLAGFVGQNEPSEYFPLAVGNYWVHENKGYSHGYYSTAYSSESCVITGTKNIHGLEFYIYEEYYNYPDGSKDTSTSLIRNRNGSVVKHPTNDVVFHKPDFLYTKQQTVHRLDGEYVYTFYNKESVGTVLTSNASYENCSDLNGAEIAMHREGHPEVTIRNMHNYYAKGIGFIQQWCPMASSQDEAVVRELVRYHVN